MAGIKELKTRIKSIGSTRKITRAMQLVSAAKMRKSQSATLQSRSYASLVWEMIQSLGGDKDNLFFERSRENKLFSTDSTGSRWSGGEIGRTTSSNNIRAQNEKKIGIILLTSNRGLVGSLNSNLMVKVKELSQIKYDSPDITFDNAGVTYDGEIISEIVTYGKKGQIIAARLKKNVVADFPKFDRTISIEDIYPIANFVSDAYNTGKYQKIVIVYNHFVSTLQQKPMVKQLLPFANERVEGIGLRAKEDQLNPKPLALSADSDVLFEPSPRSVIDHLIPRIIESQIYQTILESDASEHSARMVMMKNATEAAGDLISDLTLTFNQLRQNKITTELAEITAGKIALE